MDWAAKESGMGHHEVKADPGLDGQQMDSNHQLGRDSVNGNPRTEATNPGICDGGLITHWPRIGEAIAERFAVRGAEQSRVWIYGTETV